MPSLYPQSEEIMEQKLRSADPPGHFRQNHSQLRKIYGRKCKKSAPPQEILPVQECLQLLQECLLEYSFPANVRRTCADLRSVHSVICLLLCSQQASNAKAFAEEIRRVCRRYGFSSVQHSLLLVEFVRSKPLLGSVMSLLADILKMFDGPCLGHGVSTPGRGVTPGKSDPNMTMPESLYSLTPGLEGDLQRDCDQEQVNLVSIKRLKNSVKTDLKRHRIYLRGFECRLRGLERRAETVSRDLERANLALEALKQGDCTGKGPADPAPWSPSGSGHEAFHGLDSWLIADDLEEDLQRSLVRCDRPLDPDCDSPITKPHGPRKDPPSTRTGRVAQAGVFRCRAQIDGLMEMVNRQINQMEIEIISRSRTMTRMRHVRRSERNNTVTIV